MRRHQWIVSILLLIASCGADTKSTTPTSSTTPATSSTSSTSTGSTTTTSQVVTSGSFQPPCASSSSVAPRFEFANENALDTFGPLDPTPSLQVTLPLGNSQDGLGLVEPYVTAARIPGGLLLAARSGEYGYFEGSLLAAIDADGTTRWIRCFNEHIFDVLTAPASSGPTLALVSLEDRQQDQPAVVEWQTVDLDSGATVQSLTEPLAVSAFAVSANRALLGPPYDTVIDPAQHHLTLVDLHTMSATSIPFPEAAAGDDLYQFSFSVAFTEAGDLVFGEYDPQQGWAPTMTYNDGAWTEGVPSSAEIRIGVDVDEFDNLRLTGSALDGTRLWRVEDIVLANIEGFVYGSSGSVTLMVGCPVNNCYNAQGESNYRLYGIDNATGARLWDNAFTGVLLLGDGYALAIDGDTRIMMDTETGQLVDASQQWSPNSYYQGCCGDDVNWVQRFGGVVVATNGEHVDVWYPSATGLATQTVTIP